MKIGLDLDGTVYGFPEFFREFIPAMVAHGHEFFCTSGHARSEWEQDRKRLQELGIDPSMISPDLMYPEQNQHVHKKGLQADQLDIVFDNDGRVQQHTRTPVVCVPDIEARNYRYQRFGS